MARKVFISVLGAGLYEKCCYVSEKFKSSETTFIQQATMEFIGCKDWTAESHAYILLTDKARKDNWDVPKGERYDNRKKTTIQYQGLHDILAKMNLPFHIDDVAIPEGKDKDEMWQIFEKVYSLLEEGDELYFDLTHSFRYLPMLILVLGNYAKFLKKAKVKSITYGNWEGRNEKTNEAPIVDLLPLSSLQDWTFATADFLENGYTDRLAQLSQNELGPFLRNPETRTKQVQILGKVVSNMKRLTEERLTCRGLDVISAKTDKMVSNNLSSLSNVVITALRPVIEKLREATNENENENTNNLSNMFIAARWCKRHHLYQQSVTFLEEGIISFFCHRHGIELYDRKRRELVNKSFRIKQRNTPKEEWIVPEEEIPTVLSILADDYLQDSVLVGTVTKLMEFRNDYNHCGMRESANSIEKMHKKTDEFISTIEEIINLSDKEDQSHLQSLTRSLFLNLSNHPTAEWEETQLVAAQEFGEIADMAFPQVPPEANTTDITDIAEDTVSQITSTYRDFDITVHVMGEMTLTFAIVERLKASGIRCVASTTQRVAAMQNNTKTSEFRFVKFREY